MAPSVNPTSRVRIQSSALTSLPISVGSPIVQLPSPASKPVLAAASDVGATMSSIHTPSPWTAQSLTYEIDTVTSWPAYALRSNPHWVQPSDLPDAAFHPVPAQSAPWYCSSHG